MFTTAQYRVAAPPRIGATVAFRRGPLAGIPAKVTEIYAANVVGLFYEQRVQVKGEWTHTVDACWCDLEEVVDATVC
jgi:hypothetical protein